MGALTLSGALLAPILGFALGLRRAWKWAWIGALGAALIEADQIQVEGSWGSFATGQDFSNWLMDAAIFCAVAFYSCFLFGAAWAYSRQQDKAAERGDPW
jgi:hypothetical protein